MTHSCLRIRSPYTSSKGRRGWFKEGSDVREDNWLHRLCCRQLRQRLIRSSSRSSDRRTRDQDKTPEIVQPHTPTGAGVGKISIPSRTCPRFKLPEPVSRTRFFTDETCSCVTRGKKRKKASWVKTTNLSSTCHALHSPCRRGNIPLGERRVHTLGLSAAEKYAEYVMCPPDCEASPVRYHHWRHGSC